MRKQDLDLFMADMNSLVPLSSQASTPPKRSGTHRKPSATDVMNNVSVTPRNGSAVNPASNKRKDSSTSSNRKSGRKRGIATVSPSSKGSTNINPQDLKDGMKALKEGFREFGVVAKEGELEGLLRIIETCYDSGYCADHPGNNMEGKHVITL